MTTIPQAARYRPEFESTLPPEALDELLGRRRPQPAVKALQRPPAAWKRVLHLLAWLCAPVALVAILSAFLTMSGWQPATRGSLETQPIAQAALDRTAVVMSTPATPAAAPVAQTPEVRRAQLVPVTVRRAEFMHPARHRVDPPPYSWVGLPDSVGGGSVYARFTGTVARFSDIPANAVPGDMWSVTDGASTTTWILAQMPGYGHPLVWIDP